MSVERWNAAMRRLDDRVIVITGAGRGIGAAVARVLAAEGAKVVVNDLGVSLDGEHDHSAPAEAVVNSIRAAGGVAVASNADVTDHEAARGLVEQAVNEFGRLDVLINAAGILRDRMIFNMTPDDWEAVLRVHMTGTFNTTKHAAAYWRSRKDPKANYRLINFTSRAGLYGAPSQPNYAAAKLGIVGLTYSCANALQKYGVTSNAVSPSAGTRMTESVPGDRRPAPEHDGERSPENVAPVVAYLSSVRSSWCNGQVFSARGYQIGLHNLPEEIRQVVSTGQWDLGEAFDLIEATFRPVVTGQRLFRTTTGLAAE